MLVRLTVTINNRQRFMTGNDKEWISTLRGWTIEIPTTERKYIEQNLRNYWKDRLISWSIILHN